MASTATLEGVKKAVFFPFTGKGAGMKLLIGSAISLANYIIPIVPAIPMLGYYAQIMKGVILRDEDPELPEWNDWGTFFMDGLKMLGASLIYMLPALLVVVVGYILFFVLDFGMAFSTTKLVHSSSMPYSFLGSAIGMFAGMFIVMIGMFLMVVTMFFLPPALGNMIAKDNFGAAFRIKEWWPSFKSNFSGYILATAIVMGLAYLVAFVLMALYYSVVLCIVVPFAGSFVTFVIGAVSFSLYAVTYRDGVRKLAEAAQ